MKAGTGIPVGLIIAFVIGWKLMDIVHHEYPDQATSEGQVLDKWWREAREKRE